MDPVRLGPRVGGSIITDDSRSAYDFARLERAVATLAAEHRRVRQENAALRLEVDRQGHRIRDLDGRILEANQLRQDVAKRIDELMAQIDQLDAQFAEPGEVI